MAWVGVPNDRFAVNGPRRLNPSLGAVHSQAVRHNHGAQSTAVVRHQQVHATRECDVGAQGLALAYVPPDRERYGRHRAARDHGLPIDQYPGPGIAEQVQPHIGPSPRKRLVDERCQQGIQGERMHGQRPWRVEGGSGRVRQHWRCDGQANRGPRGRPTRGNRNCHGRQSHTAQPARNRTGPFFRPVRPVCRPPRESCRTEHGHPGWACGGGPPGLPQAPQVDGHQHGMQSEYRPQLGRQPVRDERRICRECHVAQADNVGA